MGAGDVDAAKVEVAIANGQHVLTRMRFELGVSMVGLGFAFGLGFVYLNQEPRPGGLCSVEWSAYVDFLVLSTLYYGRFFIFSLAPLVDDMRVMRLVMLIDIGSLVTDRALHWTNYLPPMPQPWRDIPLILTDVVLHIGLVWAICSADASAMHRRMWSILGVWLWLRTLLDVFLEVGSSVECRTISDLFGRLPPNLLLIYFVSKDGVRQRFQAALMTLFEGRVEVRAAAGLASLVGRCRAEEVVAQASARFRVVELAALRFEDLADNAPSPGLFARSSPAALHECDAFVSHSWHDDARAKWAALQRWRHAFVAEHGREPKVWIDKCCIDQNNIEADLRCLPVFLSGCRSLVVFCGPTYLSRLWCILELFTFVHIGRGVERIEFVKVSREGRQEEDARSVEQSFADFDAGACSCFRREDKERILSIIHVAFGGVAGFNKAVRSIFRAAGWWDVHRRPPLTYPAAAGLRMAKFLQQPLLKPA